jgi:hypothetical protein
VDKNKTPDPDPQHCVKSDIDGPIDGEKKSAGLYKQTAYYFF